MCGGCEGECESVFVEVLFFLFFCYFHETLNLTSAISLHTTGGFSVRGLNVTVGILLGAVQAWGYL